MANNNQLQVVWDKDSDTDDEAKIIFTTAAKLIESQIKAKGYSTDFYLSIEEIRYLKGLTPFKFVYGNAIPAWT